MSYFFAIILILIIIWMFFGEQIKEWARRRMMEKVEDALRAQMGMPSAKEERNRQRQYQKNTRKNRNSWQHPRDKAERSNQSAGDVIIPREYAEDVEFVEYKEFSSTTIISEDDSPSGTRTKKIITESQVSDVEYIEIKTKEK